MAKPYQPVFSHAAMLEYYRQGLSDPEIAKKVGCTASNVYRFRKANGLPPNILPPGYGRPKRKRADPPTPPPAPDPEPMPQAMRRVPKEECRQCMYLQLLSNGMAGTFCGYGLMTGRPRITLPPREDGRCPGFEAGVPDWMRSAAEDAKATPHPPAEPAPSAPLSVGSADISPRRGESSPRGEGTGGDGP